MISRMVVKRNNRFYNAANRFSFGVHQWFGQSQDIRAEQSVSEQKDYSHVVPRLASTVLLARDGADGIEVFMVKRHHKIDFASGAMVFPGGKVDDDDNDPALKLYSRGGDTMSAEQFSLAVAALNCHNPLAPVREVALVSKDDSRIGKYASSGGKLY